MTAEFLESFTRVDDRLAWSSVKWERYRGRDIIPLWIADMDFPVAPCVQQAMQAHVAHGNFGYAEAPRDLADDLIAYHAAHYGWAIERSWIVWLPGLVLGLNLAAKACAAPGESVITFAPVYPPFLHAAEVQERRSIVVPFVRTSGDDNRRLHYEIDFAALETAVQPDTRLLLLCHPHNPVGSLFSAEALATLAEFCVRHDLYVCSDEVHCDLILDGTTAHVPFAKVLAERDPAFAARCITLNGPGKVFNLAGLGIAWAIIPDAGLRRRFRTAMQRLVPDPCAIAYTALQAALREGEPWRQALLGQLRRNRDAVSQTLDELGLPHTHPDATYLTWIDARDLAARVGNPAQWLETKGLGLSDGADFGAPGFLRLNFGAPPVLIDAALERLRTALTSAA